MSINTQNVEDQEIDLSVLTQKIGDIHQSFLTWIFNGILFIKNKTKLFTILVIVGFSIGYFIDRQNNSYKSEIIVAPSLSGIDYLYSKVELLKSKLSENDTIFLNSIGMKNTDKIQMVTVEPIIDIYSFVNNSASAASAQNTQNFEMMKLLAETSSIEKVIKDKITSKNFPNHLITIHSNGKTTEAETVKPILKFLNTDEYLNQILKVTRDNTLTKMKKNEELIFQTDSLIRIFTLNLTKTEKSSSLVYNNENNEINSFFNLKNNLITELGIQKIALINTNLIIKDISTVANIKNNSGLNGKMKLFLPVLFIFCYLVFINFTAFYRNQLAKSLNKKP